MIHIADSYVCKITTTNGMNAFQIVGCGKTSELM